MRGSISGDTGQLDLNSRWDMRLDPATPRRVSQAYGILKGIGSTC